MLSCLGKAENVPKPAASQLFTDVYDEMPPHLVEQTKQLQDHLEKYGEHYNLDEFCSEESYVDPSIALIEKRKGNFPG